MPKIRVLKSFVFSHPQRADEKLTTETLFRVGEYEITDAVANHPWIKAGADGKIESAAQAVERTKAEAAKAEASKAEADAANAAATAAVARLKAAEPGATGTAEEIAAELNTPIDVLKQRRALGLPKSVAK